MVSLPNYQQRERERERESKLVSNSRTNNSKGGYFGSIIRQFYLFNKYSGEGNIFAFLGSVDSG
ncbi:hypothetical protein [endosymbiont DhMRE of Dentiscutata heterogama]|uniref:hypothetical protein n=1 Tax=endosymbiont DhMRE of Dentiscutata heterogama TaxID=1609546 RepID=UPI002AD28C7C|nr:hypothetical protein [endosymbiont DhMRE of Dentiscutata heterogama]